MVAYCLQWCPGRSRRRRSSGCCRPNTSPGSRGCVFDVPHRPCSHTVTPGQPSTSTLLPIVPFGACIVAIAVAADRQSAYRPGIRRHRQRVAAAVALLGMELSGVWQNTMSVRSHQAAPRLRSLIGTPLMKGLPAGVGPGSAAHQGRVRRSVTVAVVTLFAFVDDGARLPTGSLAVGLEGNVGAVVFTVVHSRQDRDSQLVDLTLGAAIAAARSQFWPHRPIGQWR